MKMAGLIPDSSTFNVLIQSCSAVVEKVGDPGWQLVRFTYFLLRNIAVFLLNKNWSFYVCLNVLSSQKY
jgi:hypothetical protein